MTRRLVLISDTHNQHSKLVMPKGDVIIHAGDISINGTLREMLNFLQWFSQLPYKHKIFIAGNRDFCFEDRSIKTAAFPDGVIYLENNSCGVDGLKIYGSPNTPEFLEGAFMKKRGEEIQSVWNQIPTDTDILVTHGPPITILDKNLEGEFLGCDKLLERVKSIKPKLHVFGHIHEGYGFTERFGIRFVNASVLNEQFKLVNSPVVVDL